MPHRLARCSTSNLSFRRRLRDDGVTILIRVVIGWCWHARCRVSFALSCGLIHHFDEAAIDGRKAVACRWRIRANRHATYHREINHASHWPSSSHERSRCYHVMMGNRGSRERLSLAPLAKDTASKVPLKEPLLHFIAGESFWSGPGVGPNRCCAHRRAECRTAVPTTDECAGAVSVGTSDSSKRVVDDRRVQCRVRPLNDHLQQAP